MGTLSFPALPIPTCTVTTCYNSDNDVSGLSVNAISIDDAVPYTIQGNAITLGSGGITASTSSKSFGLPPAFDLPITLGAPQTWSIDGNNINGAVLVDQPVTGEAEELKVNLAHNGNIYLEGQSPSKGSIEAGPVTLTSEGPPEGVLLSGASLNGVDAKPVALSGGSLVFEGASKVGPLTLTHGFIGTFFGQVGTLAVNGGITFDALSGFSPNILKSGTTPGTDYSQVTATGTVKLANASFAIDGRNAGAGVPTCPVLKVGDEYTLLTTTGSLEGEFANAHAGAEVSMDCFGFAGTPPTLRINYTAHAVTATVLTPGQAGPTIKTSATTPVTVGEKIKDTATIEGLVNAEGTGKVTFKLFANEKCEGTPVHEFTTATGISGSGTQEASSDEFTTTKTGTYFWTASYAGDKNNIPIAGKCDDANESSVVEESEVARKKKEAQEIKEREEREAGERRAEEAIAKKQAEEAAAKKQAEEAATKKQAEEAAAKKQAEEEAAAKKHAEEELKRKQEEEASSPSAKITKVKVTTSGIVVTITMSRAGTITITGPGLKKTTKALAAGEHQITVPFTKAGRTLRAHRQKIKITIGLKAGAKTVSGSKVVRL